MKLVRDRIPELATANGQPGTFHQARPGPSSPVGCEPSSWKTPRRPPPPAPAGLVEELGDVLQVLYALAELAGAAAAEIECARARKARTHGTYPRRLLWHPPT